MDSMQATRSRRRESSRYSTEDSTMKYIWQYSEKHGFNPEEMNRRVEIRRQNNRERAEQALGSIMEQPPVRQAQISDSRTSKRQSAIRQSILKLNESSASPRPFLRTASPLFDSSQTPGPLLHNVSDRQGVHGDASSATGDVSDMDLLDPPLLRSLTPGRNLSLLTGVNSTRDTSMVLNVSVGSLGPGDFSVQPDEDIIGSSAVEIPILSETADVTEISEMLHSDPTLTECPGLFAEFFHCFTSHRDVSQVFDLISEYEKACREQVNKLDFIVRRSVPGNSKFSKIVEMINMITQESYTWRLVHGLFRDRLEASDRDMFSDTLTQGDNGNNRSEQKIIDVLYESDAKSRENQIIVDWLEKNAEDDLKRYLDSQNSGFFTESVSWENTLHQLQQKKMSGSEDSSIVTEMDPDAPERQRRPLADLDQADEARFFVHLFVLIRAGKIDQAVDLCVKCGQAWRGATLEGWRLYHDPNMEEGPRDGKILPVIGNPQRDIWKNMTWMLTENEYFHVYERAIYAALCGNLKQLLKVCSCWDDSLWAYYKVMVDVRVEQELRYRYPRTDRPAESLPSAFWDQTLTPDKIFQELSSHPNQSVRKEAAEPINVIKNLIILNDVEGLLDKMKTWIVQPHLPSHLLRFMAHLVLFLRTIFTDLNEEICVVILHAYVKHLISEKKTLLVATYTSTLPYHMQVDTYAFFLEGIHGQNYRLQCLELAKSAGLDIPSITKKVVENIRGKDEFKVGAEFSEALEAVTSEDDKKKIEAIEWLVFDPSQRAEALKQCNAIIRCFLATHKLAAAHEVFDKIPPDSIAVLHKEYQKRGESGPIPDVDENAVREYLCIKVYLDAYDGFNSWFEHFHHGQPEKPVQESHSNFADTVVYQERQKEYEVERLRWKDTLNKLTKAACDKIYNVLLFPEGGWMVDLIQVEEPDTSRTHQMEVLRQLCIPSLTYLLHSVLFSTQQYQQCFNLADVIASEQYNLYKAFRKDELQKFLSLLRDSSIQLLEKGVDPLGYEIA